MPQIATSWKQVSDSVVEFQIRSDVVFHDGQKLSAEDVAFSVRRITDPKFGSPQLGQFDKIIKAEVAGPNTVRLTTPGPRSTTTRSARRWPQVAATDGSIIRTACLVRAPAPARSAS